MLVKVSFFINKRLLLSTSLISSVVRIVVELLVTIQSFILLQAFKNKALKELVVENYELTPNFDPQTTKYSLTLKDTDEKLNIKATPEDEKATTDITGNGDFKVGNNSKNYCNS